MTMNFIIMKPNKLYPLLRIFSSLSYFFPNNQENYKEYKKTIIRRHKLYEISSRKFTAFYDWNKIAGREVAHRYKIRNL